jgi:tRNA-Thr(GGU) m(6)t(6)A37 methyltransferase TsaA
MITLEPIGIVHSPRVAVEDDDWGAIESQIQLDAALSPEALDGIDSFSHAEVIFYFDRLTAADIVWGARHPRGNSTWPKVGIFAQRGKARPNRLGSTIVEVIGREGRMLKVRGLDAIDGTPVLDVKPVIREFLPRSPVRQPDWATELMREYWRRT